VNLFISSGQPHHHRSRLVGRDRTEKAVPFHAGDTARRATLRRLAGLKPSTIALMHGPAFKGDGGAALSALGLLRRAAQRLIVIPTEAKRSGGTSSLWRHD